MFECVGEAEFEMAEMVSKALVNRRAVSFIRHTHNNKKYGGGVNTTTNYNPSHFSCTGNLVSTYLLTYLNFYLLLAL